MGIIFLFTILSNQYVGGLVAKSSPTFVTHGLYSLPGSSVHGILQARILELKKEFIGPRLHCRPVHADHARPPLQWTLDSVLSAYGNYNRRIRPPLDRGILKITSRLLIA